MPCNAVATVRAVVAPEVVQRLLASRQAHAAIKYWLGQAVGATVAAMCYAAAEGGQSFEVVARGGTARITLSRTGDVTVECPNRTTANEIREALEAFLSPLADALLAQEVRSALAGSVTAEQAVGQAIVLTVEI